MQGGCDIFEPWVRIPPGQRHEAGDSCFRTAVEHTSLDREVLGFNPKEMGLFPLLLHFLILYHWNVSNQVPEGVASLLDYL